MAHSFALPGLAQLRNPPEGSWARAVAARLADTANVSIDIGSLDFEHVDLLVGDLLNEVGLHPFPELTLVLDWSLGKVDAVTFMSYLVSTRAERLLQTTELTAAALTALAAGSLHVAAINARALMEVAATSWNLHGVLLKAWRPIYQEPRSIRRAAESFDHSLWQALFSVRQGVRDIDGREAGSAPRSLHVNDGLRALGRGDAAFKDNLKEIYERLCEVAHPNGGAHDIFWRRLPYDTPNARSVLALDPSTSQAPIKLAVHDAVIISLRVVLPLCSDLWWAAATTASTYLPPRRMARDYGLPVVTPDDQACCCGSEVATSLCAHPEPVAPSRRPRA